MNARDRLDQALEQLRFSRSFTLPFLEDLTDDQWYWRPPGFDTHVAWQVGHIAYAEYSLCLKRVRGRRDEDESFAPSEFMEMFKIRSYAEPDPADNPSVDEFRRVLSGVHDRALAELSETTGEALDTETQPPHPVFTTKLGAVEWCGKHELVHAGQIALLRRLMGKKPLR